MRSSKRRPLSNKILHPAFRIFWRAFYLKLVIVFTRAAPAFEDLFNTYIWFLLDINTVHTNVKKETFEYLLKLTSM